MTAIETLESIIQKTDARGQIVRIFHLDDLGYVVNVGTIDGVGRELPDAIYRCYNMLVGLNADAE